ncbi:uncharacterized protein LOC117525619 isoform X2 [Thalassophryne amazonica]|uniref:uncharacterized protein LOC117525619 isoform X2 n=1 Tax=Thalassophryne amazonica TaxID=390379 RepID=UPI0014714818|nr:uncharacterized protein LOC117525619 isoform X2 [Thalassophryne amazonica]
MWSAPGINNPPMGLGMNAKNTQLCPPYLSFGSGMSTAGHNDSDGQKMREDEEDPELARKRKELQEIEEQIILKKAALYLKQGNTFMDDTASCGVRDKRVAHNTPDTSGIHAFSRHSNEDGGRAFFCHKGAPLRDRVKSVLQKKHTDDYFTKMQFKTAEETMNSFSQSKDGLMKEEHPLRRRVHELMRRMLSHVSEIPANREVADISQAPPSQSLHPAVQESIFINKGFQRFLTVLNQGVDINLLSKIVNDDTRDLPVRDDQPPAVEKKSDLSNRTEWSDKPPSHSGAQWQDYRQTNSGESKTEPASREQSNKKRISKADEKKDKGGPLGSSPSTTGGISKTDEKKDKDGHLGSLPSTKKRLSKEDEKKDKRGHLGSPLSNKKGLSKADEKKDKRGHLGSPLSNKKGISKADEKKDKGGHLGSPLSNKKGLSKADEKKDKRGHLGSSSQSQSSPSSKKGISKADEKKWSDKPPFEQWQDHRHTKSAEKKTKLASREQPNKKVLSKADAKNERRSSFSRSSRSQSSPSNNKGMSKIDEKDRIVSLSRSSPPQSSLYNNKGILKADEKEDEDRIGSRCRSRSSAAVDHVEKVDIHQKQLQNILKTLGLNLEPEEMSRLTDRTQERLYGKKIDDKQMDNSRQEQEYKQRSPKRRRSSSSSSSSSDIYRGLSPASSDSGEQGQSSDSSSSRTIPTFQESKQVQQGILRDQDRVGFKEIPSHHPYTESQIYSIPLSHVLTNYGMAHYSQHPYLSGTYNRDLNLGYTQDALSSWYYLNRYHYPQNLNALTFGAPSAGSIFDTSLMVNPDLSMSEGQSGMLSGPRYIQTIDTQHDLTQRHWIMPGYEVKSQEGKQMEKEKGVQQCTTSDSGMEVPENTDKMVSESPVLEVKEQPTQPRQEDKRQPTQPRQEDKRQPTQPRQEDKGQPTQPRQEDKGQPTGPSEEDRLKQLREKEIKANLKRKLDIFNQMVKQRFATARNSLT